MALMDILIYPDAPLKETASPVIKFGDELQRLATDMIETMQANDGVGLAAPQVGIRRQLMVFCEPEGEPMCLVNPEIVEMDGKEFGEEGCLSLPGLFAPVPRATRIRVRARDCEGNPMDFEAHDFLARVIQHEYDHLQGKVFPERLDVMTRDAVFDEWNEIRKEMRSSASVST